MSPCVKTTVMDMIEYEHQSSPPPVLPSSPTESDRAWGMALRLLALRGRTVAEMREKLGHRFGRETAEKTVARLQFEGLLNDAEFARQWRDSRERKKPRSPRMIEQELKQRGVGQEAISDALEGFDSLAAAYRAASRYAARQDAGNRAAFDRRVGAFLSRRGFEPEVVRQTLDQLRAEFNVFGQRERESEYAEE